MRDARCGSWQGLAAVAFAVVLAASQIGRAADDNVVPGAGPSEKRPDALAENPVVDVVDVGAAFAPPAVPPTIVHPQVNMAGFTREYRSVPLDASPADVAIRAALARPIGGDWEFRDASIRDIVGRVGQSLGVTVVLDEQALEDAGIDLEEQTATTRLSGLTARAALRVLLAPFDLACVAADETLTITTVEAAHGTLRRVAYPLPRWAGFDEAADAQAVVDLIQNTVALETWDVTGGEGCIRVVEAAGEPLLVVSQTGDVHDAVERLLAAIHGRSLVEFEAGRPVLKVHPVADEASRIHLEKRLKDICNATLGADGDPDAEVESVAATLAVRSRSPLFHALAAQVVAAVAGVEAPPKAGADMNGVLCWVAREVYGDDDPRWLEFRAWMLAESPPWLCGVYARHGVAAAAWLRHRPAARCLVRAVMDGILRRAAAGR